MNDTITSLNIGNGHMCIIHHDTSILGYANHYTFTIHGIDISTNQVTGEQGSIQRMISKYRLEGANILGQQ